MSLTLSPNMILPVPTAGSESGPQYALDINACMSIIDQHSHAPGYGVQITPAGININSDLLFNSNNATLVRSVRFQPQSTALAGAADLGAIYRNGVDLYYIDGVGNNIQITQSGGVAGTPGSISNLVSPASAAYVAINDTFVFQSDVNKAANIDAASILLRNLTTSSFALTLSPPTAMAANFLLILPSLPTSQKIMTLDASGNISAPYTVDNTTIAISSNIIGVPTNANFPGSSTQVNSKNIVVSNVNNTNGLAIIRGYCSSSGTVFSGEGISQVNGLGGNAFQIVFSVGFSDIPMIQVTPVSGTPTAVTIASITTSSFNFIMSNSADFMVLAIGQRT